MKRATIMLPDDLEAKLQDFLSSQDPEPTVSDVVQSALEGYLKRQDFKAQVKPPEQPLNITPAERGSDSTDTSIHHDRYFVEAETNPAST